MTTDKQFLQYLADMVTTHSVHRRSSVPSEADLYYRAWSLLDSYPSHSVEIHPRGFYALGAVMAPWTGYDQAFFFLEDLFAPTFTKKARAEVRAFGEFWAELDHWPLIVLAAEHGMQYHNAVRADQEAASDYRAAYGLHLSGTDDTTLLVALQSPGLLTKRGDDIEGMPTEYALAALGIG